MRQHSPRRLIASRTWESRMCRKRIFFFGNNLLEQLVSLEGNLHVGRVGPNEDQVVLEYQIDGGQPLTFLFGRSER